MLLAWTRKGRKMEKRGPERAWGIRTVQARCTVDLGKVETEGL